MNRLIAEFTIENERDVAWAGQRSRLLASLANVPTKRRTSFGKAATAIASDLIKSFGRGTLVFSLETNNGLPALEAEFRCLVSAACGDRLTHSFDRHAVEVGVDSFSQTIDEQERIVRIGLLLTADTVVPNETELANWGKALTERSTRDALASSQQRIRNLATRLEETQRAGVDLKRELEQVRSLNETLELLALVASKTNNGVIILDAAGIIEWVNDGFVQITGQQFKDVRGLLLPQLFRAPNADHAAADELQEALAIGQGISTEFKHVRKSGETFWTSLSVTPVTNDAGTLTRWVVIANDVTERHRYEDELLLAKEAAESANRTKSQFLASMSHEIRTPMNAIIGMTELALDGDLSEEQQDYLQTVRLSAESLLVLLNDLLDLSKIEAGKLAIDPVSFRLQDELREILHPHELQAQRKGIKLTTVIEQDVPKSVIGDPSRLRQIVTNLIGNAIKFTSQGSIELCVASDWNSGHEVELRFRVADTGIGIAADKLNTIFDTFTQAEASTSRQYGGTGLGLAICKQLVEIMGGRMWVESRLGKGSTFHFTLRMTLANEVDAANSDKSVADGSAAPRKALHLLVADDNPANRMLATRVLEKRGHKVTQATNGEEVLAAVDRTRFDAVLLDVQMPDMDGFACTERIRLAESDSSRHLPIIAVTAYAMRGDRDRCLASGMDTYIAKPLRSRQLIATVESFVTGACELDETGSARLVTDGATGKEEFDFSRAIERLEGDVEIFNEQIEYFLNDSPALLERIRKAIDTTDAHELHVAAHRMKGLAASFDADALVSLVFSLEATARIGELDGVSAEFEQLATCLIDLSESLREYSATL